MARPKTPAAAPTTQTIAKPAGAPPPRKGQDTGITRESIAAGIEAFRKAGGKIEVLGITRYPPQVPAKPKPSSKAKAKPPTPVA